MSHGRHETVHILHDLCRTGDEIRKTAAGLFDPDQVGSEDYFGGTAFSRGEMVRFVQRGIPNAWTDEQRQALSRAMLCLSLGDRRLCERYYHGGWTTGRIAAEEGLSGPAARKRLEETGEPAHQDEMRRIAVEERENAQAALPIYARAPWLDLAARTDGVFTPCAEMIAEKVAWIDRFLDRGS